MIRKITKLTTLIIFYIIQSSFIFSQNDSLTLQLNDSSKVKFNLSDFLNFRPNYLKTNFRTLPNSALNYKRFTLVSDHNTNTEQFEFNGNIQRYLDENINPIEYPGIVNQYNEIQNSIKQNKSGNLNEEITEYFNTFKQKDILISVWRTNLVHSKSEKEMLQNITASTKEMINEGYDNLSEDLLPFITMLMLEEKKHHYQFERVISTQAGSKGIINSMDIMNALSSLDEKVEAGVCRDIHDMGLRVLRPMYKVYLDEKFPDKNYNIDNYIFLHAWVTPSSQHVTLVVIDPENTRNYQELDWGRIYKKDDQEGIEIGKMVGTTIRLWQYNPEKNVTGAVNLVKSKWGLFLDNNVLKPDEDWFLNGIYNPQYSSSSTYMINAGKKTEIGISLGMLNAGEKSLSFNLRSGKHNTQISKFFQYSGVVGFQAMVIEDSQRKSGTMMWADWYSVVNFLNSVRYISNFKTTPLQILPGLKFDIYALSQLEVVWSMTHFKTNDIGFNNQLHATGDGNIWLTYGAELNYSSSNLKFDIKYGSRNFLIPTDIRLLSPNPFELIRHATVSNSGSGILANAKYKNNNFFIEPEFRYEYNKMNAQFLLYSLKFGRISVNKNQFFLKGGSFNQLQGLEYYWYAKSRIWFDFGFESSKKQYNISLHTETIKNDFITFGLSFKKFLN